MATPSCPGRDELTAYVLGTLSETIAQQLVAHLETCADCDTAVDELWRQDDSVIQRLREPAPALPELDSPECQAALARAEAIMGERNGGSGPAEPQTPSDGAPPRQLGEYEILDKLGQGGMGTVYRARHVRLEKIVAVKVLSRERMADRQAVARFAREMKAVGRLTHGNIVEAFDAREIDGTLFLAMEYVQGLDLGDLVAKQGCLPIADACELVRQVALGLQCAHENGLVHRDIKPSNLILTAAGQVKILDLGLARLAAADTAEVAHPDMTSAGTAMGTADYMAPEQATDSHSVDIRADIYSLGCTLYKLLSGQVPFPGPKYKSPIDKIMGHLRDTPAPIQSLRPDVPAELAGVLERMLAKDCTDRWATPQQVADAVGPFAAGHNLARLYGQASGSPNETRSGDASSVGTARDAMSASSDTQSRVAQKPASSIAGSQAAAASPSARAGQPGASVARGQAAVERAIRRPRVLVALGMLGLALLAGVIVLKIKRPDGGETVVEVPEGAKAKVGADGSVEVTLPDKATNPPLAQASAFSTAENEKPIESETAWQPCPAEEALPGIISRPAKLPGIHRWQVETAVQRYQDRVQPAWSPDGRSIAFGVGNSVRVVNAETLATERILLGHTDAAHCVNWAAKEQSIASIGTLRGAMRFWRPDGLLLREISLPGAGELRLSPDESRLVTHQWDGKAQIWHCDGRPGPWLQDASSSLPVWSPDGQWLSAVQFGGGVTLWAADGTRCSVRDDEGIAFAWHPSSAYFACVHADGRLVIWTTKGEALSSWDGHGGRTEPEALAWSPDGRWLASGGSDGVVRLWGLQGDPGPEWSGHSASVRQVAWSRDSRYLATAAYDDPVRSVSICEVAPSPRAIAHASLPNPGTISWSPDSARVAFGTYQGALAILDVQPGRLRRTGSCTTGIWSIAWGTDAACFAARAGDSTARLWRNDGRLLKQLSECGDLRWQPGGRQVVLRTKESLVLWETTDERSEPKQTTDVLDRWDVYRRMWNPAGTASATYEGARVQLWNVDGSLLRSLDGHAAEVRSAGWAPTGDWIASLDADGTVRLWNLDGSLRGGFTGEKGCRWIHVRPDGQQIALVKRTADGVSIWSLNGERKGTMGIPNLIDFAWSPDGRRMVCAAEDGQEFGLKMRNSDGMNERLLLSQQRPISALAWANNSRDLAFGTTDGTLFVWDIKANTEKWASFLLTDGTHVSFSPAGQILDGDEDVCDKQLVYVVQRTPDGPQELWTYRQFEDYVTKAGLDLHAPPAASEPRVSNPKSEISDPQFSAPKSAASPAAVDRPAPAQDASNPLPPGGPLSPQALVASPSPLAGLATWDLALRTPSSTIEYATYSPDGKWIATASGSGVRVYDSASGQIAWMDGGRGCCAAWSPDGRCLAFGTDDSVEIVDFAARKRVKTISGLDGLWPLAWSPDGQRLVVGGRARRLQVVEVESGKTLCRMEETGENVVCVAWSPDGKRIANANSSDSIKLWDAASGNLLGKIDESWGWRVAWSPDGKYLAGAAKDPPRMVVWDAQTLKPRHTLDQDPAFGLAAW